jgi:alkylation response protein AidB-like acyl-CoA dehydrogenase
VTISFALDPDQQLLADSVRRFCIESLGSTAVERSKVPFTRQLWKSLAALGVFGLARDSEESPAAAGLIVAVSEELGRAGFPGPIAATLVAAALLDPELAEAVVAGDLLVSLGTPPLMPWAADADLHVGLLEGRARLLAVGGVAPLATLGGESWGRVTAAPGKDLGQAEAALVLYDLCLGAYFGGAGLGLVEAAAEHVNNRRQFGKPIASFQAVSFPLANAVIDLDSAQLLVRVAAMRVTDAGAGAPALARAARLAAGQAALKAAFTAHQAYGAFGVTADGPVAWLSRRIQQWQLQAPSQQEGLRAIPFEVPQLVQL